MTPGKARFVTGCQQLLVLGVVLAVLAPASTVISLDVVVPAPTAAARPVSAGAGHASPGGRPAGPAGPAPTVGHEPVAPVVTEYPLGPAGLPAAGRRPRSGPGSRGSADETMALSRPEPVEGYGAVGVTWAATARPVPESDLRVQVRTRDGGAWSGWTDLEYDAAHGPDPGSEEARGARPGTDPLLVGEVDQVQARATTVGGDVPAGLRMAVVDPGTPRGATPAAPAIDTARLAGAAAAPGPGTYTPRPRIFSRAQWGADERLRDAGSLRYYEVHAGFVHHTVNANDYSRADVPAIIRGIYAYHTRSRGWSDIGYNFLVDRFGRIWEGRYGGVDRPVVGAHTVGYNDYAFAMAAIGNFELVRPSRAVLTAYGRLFAWKLSLHGVAAGSARQQVGPRVLRAINGHRDAGSTACPGRYLYARLGAIRSLAAAAQRDWSGRERDTDLVATGHPDLVLRRAGDKRAYLLPTGGLLHWSRPVPLSRGWAGHTALVVSPDLDSDGRADLVARGADGVTRIRPGTGRGGFGAPIRSTRAFAGYDQLTAVGDLDRDGHHDLVARWPGDGRLYAFLGGGHGGFTRRALATGFGRYDLIAATGDLTGDGRVDLVARNRAGRLFLYPGATGGALSARTGVPGAFGGYDVITGFGDYDGDARADLVVRRRGSGAAFVLPGRGDGTFGHWHGPVPSLRGLGLVSGGGQLVGRQAPDLVGRVRGRLVLVRNVGTVDTRPLVRTRVDLARADLVLAAGDWDRDGFGDLVVRTTAGVLELRRGDGTGRFGSARVIGRGFGSVGLLAAVGDMTGDGRPDLMGQPAGGALRIYPGAGAAGLGRSYVAHSRVTAWRQVGVGRWDGDGAPDSLFRFRDRLTLYRGNGPGGLMRPRALGVDMTGYDWVVGVGDVDGAGYADVVVRERATGYLWLLRGGPTGFRGRRFLAEGLRGFDLVG